MNTQTINLYFHYSYNLYVIDYKWGGDHILILCMTNSHEMNNIAKYKQYN